MLSIENLDPKKYKCYALVNQTCSSAEAFLIRSQEDVLYDDVDFFSIEDKTIIAFKEFDLSNSEYAYKIVLDNNSYNVQYETYERMLDIILDTYDAETTSFILMDSVELPEIVNSSRSLTMHGTNRCDINRIGPFPFDLRDNGLGEELRNPIYHTADNIVEFKPVLSSPKNLHIHKFTWKNYPDEAYKNYTGVVGICRTFGGALKLLIEWSDTTISPWNSLERIAIACNSAIKSLNIPEEVLDSIRNWQVDMPVLRYISGTENARDNSLELRGLPSAFKQWYMNNIRSESLNSLSRELNLNIPNNLLDDEKNFFDITIYRFMLENNIDTEQTTLDELLTTIQDGSIKNQNDDIDNIISIIKRLKNV
jgi:hypothetical protein